MGYTPHVLVVGGGATGAAVARDLAMRGLEVTLVEREDLGSGATTDIHGMLHSGARYADVDPETASACMAENRTLRRVGGQYVDDAGGLFVQHPDDPESYIDTKREACLDADIPVEAVSGAAAREQEPALTDSVIGGLRVPDAMVDTLGLTVATARSARDHGAEILTHTAVTDIRRTDGAIDDVVLSASDAHGTSAVVDADFVINAAGAWAGEVAQLAGVDPGMSYSKGAFAVVDFGEVETILTRCRPETEGDILVPSGDHAVIGTTDVAVDGPGDVTGESWELDALVEALSTVVPAIDEAAVLRASWAVRSYYDADGDGEQTRGYTVLDHEERDGLWGFTTVVGGTFTTHRLVAEAAADHICRKFGIEVPCQTAEEPLPGRGTDERTASEPTDVPVVCPCTAATSADVTWALERPFVPEADLRAVRRYTDATDGRCQGGRCCHRIASELYPAYDDETVQRGFAGLFAECWADQRHGLWGDQLSRAMDTYALHQSLMNRSADSVDLSLDAFDGGPQSADGETE